MNNIYLKSLTLSILILVSPATFAYDLIIDDFSDTPAKKFNVIPSEELSTNLINGQLSRNFYSTNPLVKSSDQVVNILGFDPRTFDVSIGEGKLSVSCPSQFSNTFLTLDYQVDLNLLGASNYFEVIAPQVDHWKGITITLGDEGSNYTSCFDPADSPSVRFYLTNFNNGIDFSKVKYLQFKVDFNSSSDFAINSIKYFSQEKSNTCPVGASDFFEVARGSMLIGNVITNDYDADGDFIYTLIETPPVHGRLAMANSGAFYYIHNGTDSSIDYFVYKVFDTSGCFDVVTVQIKIKNNSCPVVIGETIEVPIGGSSTYTTDFQTSLLANDSDPDKDRLSIAIETEPIYGTLSLNKYGNFIYIHNGGEYTLDSFVYKVTDSNGCSTLGTVIVVALPCKPCEGKISEVALLYTGGSTMRVTASVKNGNYKNRVSLMESELVQPNKIILFNGRQNQDPRNGFRDTLGTELVIVTNGVYMDTIHTSCSAPLNVGDVFGPFTVVSLKSKINGFVCD